MTADSLSLRPPSLVTLWALLGVMTSLSSAIYRLSPWVIDAFTNHRLTGAQLAFVVGWTTFMCWTEGYKGFQLGFSPRVAARALAMGSERRPLYVALAPLVAMGLLNSTLKQKLRTGGVICAVIVVVAFVRRLEQPWRGLVDVGVVAGLAWGLVTLVMWFIRGLRGQTLPARVEFAR